MSTINKQTVAEIVAQFAAKHPKEVPPAKKEAPPVAVAPPPPPPAPAPPPAVKIVDFVSESDVRIAMNRDEKIVIGPKTIVTPAARDLAAVHDTLVMHHR